MRGSIIGALAALCLLQCNADDDQPGMVAHGPSGSGGNGSGGAPTGTAGHDSTLGSGGAAVAGSGGGGMAGKGSGGAGSGGMGSGGKGGAGGMGSGGMGSGGKGGAGGMGSGGMGSGGAAAGGDAETGRMVGMTAAHNVVRSEVETTPPLPPMKWSAKIAKYAQEWADGLNKNCDGVHRTTHEYGENIASFGSSAPGNISTAQKAVDGWGGEVACWTYGVFMNGDKCDMSCTDAMYSDGCGHYTQVVWRDSVELGCGVTTCQKDGLTWDIWVCNYDPPGNYPAAPY